MLWSFGPPVFGQKVSCIAASRYRFVTDLSALDMRLEPQLLEFQMLDTACPLPMERAMTGGRISVNLESNVLS